MTYDGSAHTCGCEDADEAVHDELATGPVQAESLVKEDKPQ